MASTIYTLANVSANVSGSNVTITGVLVSNVAWMAPAARVRIRDTSNPNFTRQMQLSDDGLLAYRPGVLFGIQVEDVMRIAYACVPGLTWPPVIATEPADANVAHPTGCNFAVAATSENNIAMTYQWQLSTDGGNTFSNLASTGVYSNTTTSNMGVSNSTGLNGYQYRCGVQNVSGLVYSDAATLTVT